MDTKLENEIYNCDHPSAWMLVYWDGKIITKREGGHCTGKASGCIIEDFETEVLIDQRISDLGLTFEDGT